MRLLLVLLCTGWCGLVWAAKPAQERWVVYYNDKAPVSDFLPYSLIVFDSLYHPPVRDLVNQGKQVLGYISLGEVEQIRPYFAEVKEEGLLGAENPDWPGSYFVDLRDPRWTKRVVEELIPQILHQRFDGLFFDTLDNAAHLERMDPERYKGMTKAAARLVKTIRLHYPDIPLMINRGFELWEDIADDVDLYLGESVYTDYNFETKEYGYVSTEDYQFFLNQATRLKKLRPSARIFTLDYWYPKDRAVIKNIYDIQRKRGFIPYVATVDLHKIIPEPK